VQVDNLRVQDHADGLGFQNVGDSTATMSPRAHQAIEHIIDTYVFVGEWIWGCAEVRVVLDVIRLETDSFRHPDVCTLWIDHELSAICKCGEVDVVDHEVGFV
jgi:hypothetical protein